MMRWLWMAFKLRLFVGQRVVCGKRFHLGILSYVGAHDRLEIGDDVYIGKFCSIQCNGRIGSGTLIANNVGIVGRRDHDFRVIGKPMRMTPWVGDDPQLALDPSNAISVGADVWVGYGAILLSGIAIGRGSVVAAGAVVFGDVTPYSIVSGNPAREVGRRFSDEQIAVHEAVLATAGFVP